MSDDLDRALRTALKPVEPTDGFADRVMARVEAPAPVRGRQTISRARWFPMALAASVAILAAVLLHERQLRQERAGIEARQQLIEALRISGEKLDLAYRVVNADSQLHQTDDPGA